LTLRVPRCIVRFSSRVGMDGDRSNVIAHDTMAHNTPLPRFPSRRPLSPGDHDLVHAALAAEAPEVSDFTFACLWIWRRTLPVELAALEGGGLAVVLRSERCGAYALPPFGARDPVAAAVRLLHGLRETDGPQSGLRLVPETLARKLEAQGLRVEDDPAASDYVYLTADLIELPGKRYDAKRNWVRRCLAAHDCRYERMAGPVVPECAAYMEEWCIDRACEEDADLCAEASAVREALAAWDALGLRGGAVRVDGRIRGFAVGERLSPAMGVQHFEKADSKIPGLYQVVNQWFTREEFAGMEWVNREEDLGNAGLRKAKQSYHPARLVKKFVVSAGD
jgi:hypothetical protein